MVKTIKIQQNVFAKNDEQAEKIRNQLKNNGTLFINFMSSPGSGKTTALTALINYLKNKIKIGEMDVDNYSSIDADRINKYTGIESMQINNCGLCHIDADMVERALKEYDIKDLDLLILENIGNLVCPAEFDTGAHLNIMILSIPEGDDKPLKYPLMFSKCDVILFNKIDTLPYFDFDINKAKSHILKLNKDAVFFEISGKTKQNIDLLGEFIIKKIKELVKNDKKSAE